MAALRGVSLASSPSVGASRRVSPRAPARSPRERVVVAPPDRSRVALRYREDSYDLGSYDPEMDGYVPPEVSLANFSRGDLIGSGSFGDVFRCVVDGDRRCVAKQYKRDVRGRDWFSFYADERATCRRLAEDGCVGVAPFVGVCGSDQYLVWDDVGVVTLAAALEGDDGEGAETLDAVAEAMALDDADRSDDAATLRALAIELVSAVLAIHASSVVHRDVKCDNAILTSPGAGSPGGRVVMCDLGGAADFVDDRNCDPDEAIFDPTYGAPEQFRRERRGGGVSGGLGGLFGGLGKSDDDARVSDLTPTGAPITDGFDAFSVGLVVLRAATPSLRPRGAMRRARRAMEAEAEANEAVASGDASVVGAWAEAETTRGVCDFSLLRKAGLSDVVDGLCEWDPARRMSLTEAREALLRLLSEEEE
jgi:serine/threonine protein kinase